MPCRTPSQDKQMQFRQDTFVRFNHYYRITYICVWRWLCSSDALEQSEQAWHRQTLRSQTPWQILIFTTVESINSIWTKKLILLMLEGAGEMSCRSVVGQCRSDVVSTEQWNEWTLPQLYSALIGWDNLKSWTSGQKGTCDQNWLRAWTTTKLH